MRRAKAGFTLIEVMVAMAIFGTAALAAINAASSHLSSIGQIQNKSFAQYVASNRMVELSLTKSWPVADNQSGQVRLAGQPWQWRQQVAETVTPNVVAVTVTVSRPESDGELIRLTRYLRRPEQASESDDSL